MRRSGFSEGQIEKISKEQLQSGEGKALLRQAKIAPEDIDKLIGALKSIPLGDTTKIEVPQGSPQGRRCRRGRFTPPKLKELQALQGKYGMLAFPKEMNPQRLSAEQVRGTFQNQGLGEDPITAAIKQVHRDNWEKIQTEVLSRLDKLLRGVNPNG